ncbi:MAG: threonine aldolase [Micromonosporaceae bacterium]|nr:threonine aldolase [Micromonosporaceae bacterium]
MAETQQQRDHRFHLMRACARQLSGERRPTMREALAAIADSPLDLDGFGDYYGDGPVIALEERVAELLGKPAAVFFPTGIMAQQVALRIWAGRTGNHTVALHPLSHPDQHEGYAYSALAGLRAVWPTSEPRPPTADEVRDLPEPYGTLMLELPLREPGFLLPSWAELVAVVGAARDRGARVHFDGARLWESTPHLGQDLPTIAALADTVYVSLYKSLRGLAGAALAGDTDVVAEARAWRRRYGGTVFQQWPAAISALAGLQNELPRLPSYVEHARVVAAALAGVPGARVYPLPPHTHEFQLWLPGDAESLNRAALQLAEEEKTWFGYGFADHAPSGYAHTEIRVGAPALLWTADDVRSAAASLLALARG